jgi:hypothetical protein
MSNSQPFLNPLPLSRASPPSLKFYSVSSQAQLKLFGAFPLWWGYAILPGGCSQSRFPENRLYKSGFDPQNDGRDRQWWAKLLRLLTVNSLSYFVKIKY